MKKTREENFMKHQANLKEQYIQLVETFITAIESGRSGAELEEIRNDIRIVSAQLGLDNSVENHAQLIDPLTKKEQENEK